MGYAIIISPPTFFTLVIFVAVGSYPSGPLGNGMAHPTDLGSTSQRGAAYAIRGSFSRFFDVYARFLSHYRNKDTRELADHLHGARFSTTDLLSE